MVLIAFNACISALEKSRFRPLAGIMVLISYAHIFEPRPNQDEFPSPCGDYGSYQMKEGFI